MNRFFRDRVNRISLAVEGLLNFFSSGIHAKVHMVSAVAVVVMGLYFDISSGEWAAVLLAIGLVIQSEIFNTILENLMDFVHEDYHKKIKYMKDMSASAVLFCSIVALTIGLIVFIPKFL